MSNQRKDYRRIAAHWLTLSLSLPSVMATRGSPAGLGCGRLGVNGHPDLRAGKGGLYNSLPNALPEFAGAAQCRGDASAGSDLAGRGSWDATGNQRRHDNDRCLDHEGDQLGRYKVGTRNRRREHFPCRGRIDGCGERGMELHRVEHRGLAHPGRYRCGRIAAAGRRCRCCSWRPPGPGYQAVTWLPGKAERNSRELHEQCIDDIN